MHLQIIVQVLGTLISKRKETIPAELFDTSLAVFFAVMIFWNISDIGWKHKIPVELNDFQESITSEEHKDEEYNQKVK